MVLSHIDKLIPETLKFYSIDQGTHFPPENFRTDIPNPLSHGKMSGAHGPDV